MGKKDTRTPQQRRADRARLREWTQEQGIELKTFEDVQELFKDFVANDTGRRPGSGAG